eukprot:71220_1
MASKDLSHQVLQEIVAQPSVSISDDHEPLVRVLVEDNTTIDGSPDLSMLVNSEMPTVVRNLEFRYSKMTRKHPYTSVSTILLAVNPYERLPIYGQDIINEFHESMKKGRLPKDPHPHPYGVAARSYMRMIQRKCNQSIVVSG